MITYVVSQDNPKNHPKCILFSHSSRQGDNTDDNNMFVTSKPKHSNEYPQNIFAEKNTKVLFRTPPSYIQSK